MLRSFIEVHPESHFPLQNLPYGIFHPRAKGAPPRVGVAIGEYVLDLAALAEATLFKGEALKGGRCFAKVCFYFVLEASLCSVNGFLVASHSFRLRKRPGQRW
jgi:hypothetical protein